MRTHIAKALKTRSKAVRSAVHAYNNAAATLSPPRDALDVKTVLEYVFLGEFDLLRDSQSRVQEQPWTSPLAREAMTAYFKLTRAREEIVRLNIESRRLHTFIRDHHKRMEQVVNELRADDPLLVHQLQKMQLLQLSRDIAHVKQLTKMEGCIGYSGTIGPGRRVGGVESDLLPDSYSENSGTSLIFIMRRLLY